MLLVLGFLEVSLKVVPCGVAPISDMKGRDCSKVLKRRGLLGRLGWTSMQSKSARSMPVKCRALLLNRLNFKKSAVPSRIMFFDHGSWIDFPPEAAATLVGGFIDGRPTVEVRIDGSMYLVDFLRMLQVDLGSGCERSIAWIDVNGNCFFPKYFVGEHGDQCERDESCLKLEIEINIDPSEGSMVGNGGDASGSGVDRVSASSKTRGEDCRLITDRGVCDDRVQEPGNCGRFDCLEKCSDGEMDVKVGKVEPGLLNRGDADSPMESVCKDSVREKGHVGTLPLNLLKQAGEKCALAAENASLCLPGGVVKSFNHKRALTDMNLDCSVAAVKEEEQIDNSYTRKKAHLEGVACGIGASAGPSKLEMVSLSASAREDKPPHEVKDCLLGMSKVPMELQGTHLTTKEVAFVETDVNNGCPYPHNGERNVGSGMELLLNAVVSKSAKVPVVNHMKSIACPDGTPAPISAPSRFDSLVPHFTKLNDDTRAYSKIKNEFLKGLGKIGPHMIINAIYWCSRTSPSSVTRFHSFQRHLEMMKKIRGDTNANVKYAWHGTSAESVEKIVLHGFGEPKASCGSESYGTGIYLCPQEKSHLSVLYAEPDDNGQQHVLLCRVILGNMEQVQPGSHQFHPSNENFDSGVDDLSTPRHYIVWSTRMNAHILPEYVLTFTLPNHLKGTWTERSLELDSCEVPVNKMSSTDVSHSASPPPVQTGSTNPLQISKDACNKVACSSGVSNMSFPKLFLVLEERLPHIVIQKLENLYHEYKAGKVAKEILLRNVRATVGDNLLIEAINSIRSQV